MLKWFKALLLISISAVFLVGCGGDDATYQVGVSQFVEHPSLDEAYKGFQAAIEDADLDVAYDFQSAQGDFNNVNPIAQNFVADEVDLIFANATPSAQGALQEAEDTDIPIVFTSVTDAIEAELVDAMDEPGDNITGVVDLHPESIQKTIEFIEEYFAGSTVGLIYNAGEQNSVVQVDQVNAAVEGTSLSTSERTVANSSEVQQAADSLVGEADVFFIVTDNTAVSALDIIVETANDHEIPLMVGEPDSLEQGGFATFGIDYHTIGYRTGEMAVELLSGDQSTKDIPVEYPEDIHLFINKQAAEDQGIEWDYEWEELAEIVE